MLLQVKDYLIKSTNVTPKNDIPSLIPPKGLGVSDFIEWKLGTVEKITAREIAEAWAIYSNVHVEDVRTTISNALNRLKNDLEKIDSEAIGIGRKDGYYWFKK